MIRIITEDAVPFIKVEEGTLPAITGRRPKRKKDECGDELWVNMGAGGLGDSLLGLCALRGLRKAKPEAKIIYRVKAPRIPFVGLFDGGYDGLADHEWDQTWNDFPEEHDARDLQMNAGYKEEVQGQAQITRLQRYCRNVGWVMPELPPLRDAAALEAVAKDFAGYVAFCPFTDLQSREWPLFYWLTLEKMLLDAGIPVIICGEMLRKEPPDPKRFTPDLTKFRSTIAVSTKKNPIPPLTTASILFNAACIISPDSGLAHLAGIMGKPTIIICGWSVGERIYGFYPQSHILQGTLPCNGCWTLMSKGYEHDRCSVVCDNLSTVMPEQVFEEVCKWCSIKSE